jgi:hypothetical protein
MAKTISAFLQVYVTKVAIIVKESQRILATMKLIEIVSVFSDLLLANRRSGLTKLRNHFLIYVAERNLIIYIR